MTDRPCAGSQLRAKRCDASHVSALLTSVPDAQVLDAELRGLGLAKARHQGLPPEWVARLAEWDPERRQVRSAPTDSGTADDDATDGTLSDVSEGQRTSADHCERESAGCLLCLMRQQRHV
jgi:hypothetical protein